MDISNHDYKKLKELEESLWRAETRFDSAYMDTILAQDFFEFGRSGRIYQRNDTLHGASPQEIKAKFPLKNFRVHEISENVVLITYVSEVVYEEIEVANRSSLWVKTSNGWQLRFHQGTPVVE